MAARKRKILHDEKTKRLIQASQLINRLISHANGEIELSMSQIQAAKIVIGKYVPDLKAVELTGKDGGPIQTEEINERELARRILFALESAARSN